MRTVVAYASAGNLVVLGPAGMTRETLLGTSNGPHRFAALLSGQGSAPYDKPLLVEDAWIVAPTLGAISSGWLLAIAREPVLNLRDWSLAGERHPNTLLARIRSHLGLLEDEIIWFEHGPSKTLTEVGCGLDQAHLHILIRPAFSFDEFVGAAMRAANLGWRATDATCGYDAIECGSSYLIAGSGAEAIVASGVEHAGSQFFRRVVATLLGRQGKWDYRTEPHLANIKKTVALFRRLERMSSGV